jgi:hypothetical protein
VIGTEPVVVLEAAVITEVVMTVAIGSAPAMPMDAAV